MCKLKGKSIVKFGVSLCILIFGFLIFAVTAQEVSAKKAVMIIAEKNFQDDELAQPKRVLEENNIEVTVASTSLKEATGMLGAKVKPDILVSDIDIGEFDVIVFVGGSGATQYLDDPLAHKLAQDALSKKRIVAAICIAPVTLAKAGILKGKKVTVWPSEGGKLKDAGADYTASPVEVDGRIITASGPAAAKEFGEEIVKALNESAE